MIDNVNRDELYEALYEAMNEINDLVIGFGLPNIESFDDETEIDDEDLVKTFELLRDLNDLIKQQI